MNGNDPIKVTFPLRDSSTRLVPFFKIETNNSAVCSFWVWRHWQDFTTSCGAGKDLAQRGLYRYEVKLFECLSKSEDIVWNRIHGFSRGFSGAFPTW